MNSSIETQSEGTLTSQELAGKYLTFLLEKESYGIPVLKIREIIQMMAITTVPEMPTYVEGVINLRGKIIPVIDLRRRFGMKSVEHHERTCILVVQIEKDAENRTQMGLVVDGVEEVINILGPELENPPRFGAAIKIKYLLGMAKIKERVKILLDIDRVICADTSEQFLVSLPA